MAGFYETLALTNYKKAMSGAYTRFGVTSDNVTQNSVNDALTLRQNVDNGAVASLDATKGESHDTDKNWWLKTWDAINAFSNSVYEGVLKFADGIGDFAMGMVGTVASWAGNHDLEEEMKKDINVDWTASVVNFNNKLANATGLDWISGRGEKEVADGTYGSSWFLSPEEARKRLNEIKYGNVNDTVADVATGVGEGLGRMIPSLAIGDAVSGIAGTIGSVGGTAAGAEAARTANIVTQAVLGTVQGTGGGYAKAAQDGADLGKASGYALLSGTLQGASQALSAGIGGTYSSAVTNRIGDAVATKVFGEGVEKSFSRGILAKGVSILSDMAMDSAMDVAQEAVDPVLRQIYDDNAIADAYGAPEAVKQTMKSLGMTAITSAITSGIVDTARAVGSNYAGKRRAVQDVLERDDVKEAREGIEADARKAKDAGEILKQAVQMEPSEERDLLIAKQSEIIEKANTGVQEKARAIYTEIGKAEAKAGGGESSIDSGEVSRVLATSDTQKVLSKAYEAYGEARAVKPSAEDIRNVIKPEATKFRNVSASFSARLRKDGGDPEGLEMNVKKAVPGAVDEALGYMADDGRKSVVRVDSEDLRFGPSHKRVTFDSTDNDSRHVNLYRDVLRSGDTFTEYDSPSGKKTFRLYGQTDIGVETDNETGVSRIILPDEKKPDYYGRSSTFGEEQSNANPRLWKKASPARFTSASAVSDFADEVLGNVIPKNVGGYKRSGGLDEAVKRLASGYSLDFDPSDEASAGKVHKDATDFVDRLMEERVPTDNVGGTSSVKDLLGLNDEEYGEYKVSLRDDLEDYLNTESSLSRQGKLTGENTALRAKENRLKADVRLLKGRMSDNIGLSKLMTSLRNRVAKADSAPSAGAPNENPTVSPWLVDLSHHFSVTKASAGATPETAGYLVDMLAKADAEDTGYLKDVLHGYSELEDEYNQLSQHVVAINGTDEDGQDTVTYRFSYKDSTGNTYQTDRPSTEDNKAIYHMIQTLMGADSLQARKALTERKARWVTATAQASALTLARKGVASGKVSHIARGTISPITYFRDIFGMDSSAFRMLVTDPMKDYSDYQVQQASDRKFIDQKMKDFGITEEGLSKNMHFDGLTLEEQEEGVPTKARGTLTMTKEQAMSIYAMSQSDNLDELLTKGVSWIDPKTGNSSGTFRPTAQQVDAIASALTDNEKGFAYAMLKEGYNGQARSRLIAYDNSHGSHILDSGEDDGDGLWMHIDRNNLRINVSDEKVQRQGMTSLGEGILKRRVNSKHAMAVGQGIVSDYLRYMDSVNRVTTMDHVRDMDKWLNHSTFHRTEGNQMPSPANSISNNVADGSEFLRIWVSALNGTSDTKNMPKILSNALGTMVNLNPGTYLKMGLDAFRLVPRYGLKATGKGILRGLSSLFDSDSRAVIKDIADSSGTYREMNEEQWAVRSNVLSSNYSRFVRALGNPLQAINNGVFKYTLVPTLQELVASQHAGDSGYAVGTRLNSEAVTDMLDTGAFLQTYSNGSGLDMSPLRRGERSQIVQSVFGTFGGDSQKWSEVFYNAFFGTQNAKRRMIALDASNTKLNTDIGQTNQEIEAMNADIQKLQSGYTDESGNFDPSMMSDRDRLSYQNKVAKRDAYRSYVEQMQSAIAENTRMIGEAREYVTPRRVAGRAMYAVGTLVAVASVEALINALTAKMKGRDETRKDFAEDVACNAFLDWIPYIGTFASMVKYDENFSPIQLSALNYAKNTAKSVGTWVTGGFRTNDLADVGRNLAVGLGYSTGLPVKTIADYFAGAAKNISDWTGDETGYRIYQLVHGYNASYLEKRMDEGRKANDRQVAKENLTAYLAVFSAGAPREEVTDEIARLYMEGNDALPGTNLDSEEGYTGAQKRAFREIYARASGEAYDLITSSQYRAMTDEQKAKALKRLYAGFRDAAKRSVSSSGEDKGGQSRLSRVIEMTEGRAYSGRALAVAMSAKGRSDVMRASSLSYGEKLLALYLMGESLSETQKRALMRYLGTYAFGKSIVL